MWPYLNKVLINPCLIPLYFETFYSLGSDVYAQCPQAICKQVKTIAEPIIAEQIPNYKIDSVQFEALSLGCLPPAFTGWAVLFINKYKVDRYEQKTQL